MTTMSINKDSTIKLSVHAAQFLLSDHANLMQHKNQEPYYIPDVDNG
jgi:hypothetical protein